MSGKPLITVVDTPVAANRRLAALAMLSDYWALTKPEVNFLILITTFAGFYLGCANAGREFSFLGLFNTLLGTLLVASGTATLNQYIERKFDAQMRRTSRRPLAAGRLEPSAVLAFGVLLSVAGGIYLAVAAGVLSSEHGAVPPSKLRKRMGRIIDRFERRKRAGEPRDQLGCLGKLVIAQ